MLRALATSLLLLAATPAVAADFPPGPGTTGVLGFHDDEFVISDFDFAGDIDAFRITLPTTKAFVFAAVTSCRQKQVRIYNAGFNLLKTSIIRPIATQLAALEWQPKYAGLYFITISDVPQPDGGPGCSSEYELYAKATCLAGIATKCGFTTTPGETSRPGALWGDADKNFYKFTILRRRPILIEVAGGWATKADGPVITIRDASNKFLFDSRDSVSVGGNTQIFAEFCPGTYYAVIRRDNMTTPMGYIMRTEAFTRIPGGC